ncbi:MAG: hypothetical protein PVS2B2_24290 [Candidatus Acidiferrum sp.]
MTDAQMETEQFRQEREKLRMLCSWKLSARERRALCGEWKAEEFFDATHRVIFEEICKISALEVERLRELLPGRVTNRGFPDVDMEEYFLG